MDWGDFIQNSAGKFLDARLEYDYKAPVDIEKMRLMAYGPYGQPYQEGQPNSVQGQASVSVGAQIPQAWLLIGGAVALFLLVGD